MPTPCVVLLVNLLQDVNILRPLAYIAARDLGLDTRFLLTRDFEKRDKDGRWQAEIAEIARAVGATSGFMENEGRALQVLQGLSGIIVAASESNLSGHRIVHDVFRSKPPSFVTMTLQHGFECVGFLQSRDHDLAHGREVTFAADIVCGWCEPERLTALALSQRNKLCVTGPTAVLQQPPRQERLARGIVCENLHSVRLNVAGDFKTDFVDLFGQFCEALDQEGKDVVLRPHPGGQYVVKNNVSLPKNVVLNNNPIYKANLSRYAYGISAPSSVLIDMVLAGIPTAVWREGTGVMDADNYRGLTTVSDLPDWLEFEKEALAHPERFIERQAGFLDQQKMLTDREEVYRRFAGLLWSAARRAVPTLRRAPSPPVAERRVMFVANNYIPTLQLSFVKPLAPLVEAGKIETDFLTEEQMTANFGKNLLHNEVRSWIDDRLKSFEPTLMVFCRYSGPHAEYLTDWARRRGVPILFHIDDDLLNIPIELGKAKYALHNQPARLSTVRHLLNKSNLVYCSTPALKERLKALGAAARLKVGKIYASATVLVEPTAKPVTKIGYMGFDHAHDLETVVPALTSFLRRNPHVSFELFGSIPKPAALEELGERVTVVPPVRNYEEFLTCFSQLNWDIGICPLAPTPFNLVKANTKWVEYTSVGVATIASAKTIYDDCCAGGCGLLADTQEEWIEALELLSSDPTLRHDQVMRAQQKLRNEYSTACLREQVLSMFADAEAVDVAPRPIVNARRVMFVANNYLPTLQLSFVKPLAGLMDAKQIDVDFLTESQMKEVFQSNLRSEKVRSWIEDRLRSFDPTLMVFCRYSGPHAEYLTEWAHRNRVPVIFHIDDDLLNVPIELGEEKYEYHNRPTRLATVRHLLNASDLVYCSNSNLQNRLVELGVRSPLKAGRIYASGHVLSLARNKPVLKIGYMASADHAHNLEMIKPAVVEFLRRNPTVRFELFGSIPKLSEFEEFGDRVSKCPPIANYKKFMESFAALEWDIGICPLMRTPFNIVKSNTKWVEYTSVGAAVIASRDTVYDDCCADDCGILAETHEEWLAALERLAQDPILRYEQVQRAQEKLMSEYSTELLREQVLTVFDEAEASSLGNPPRE